MKVNRDRATAAGLALLNEVGLEGLTLRLLAQRLEVQAPALYWHFKSKEDLIDEMATSVLAAGAQALLPPVEATDWRACVLRFGAGLRQLLLAFRDGARMVSGTRLTNLEYMRAVEQIATRLVAAGFTVRQTAVLLSTVYSYTISFVMEEQAVFPRPGERSGKYDLARRSAALRDAGLPLLRQAGEVLFDDFDRRYDEGLALILEGAGLQIDGRPATVKRSPRAHAR